MTAPIYLFNLSCALMISMIYHARVEPPLPHFDKTVSPAELWWGSREPMPQTKPREASCVLVVVLQEEEDGRATFQPVGEAAAGSNVECQSSWKRG